MSRKLSGNPEMEPRMNTEMSVDENTMETLDQKIADMTIEETFAALDALIDQLESGKGSLEDAFKNYEEGMKLVKSCNEKIEKIEKQILVLGGESMEDTKDGQYF